MGRFRSRLKASLQGATALGIAMILLTWGTIAFQLHVNRNARHSRRVARIGQSRPLLRRADHPHRPRHRFHAARPARDLCEEYRELRPGGMDLACRHRDGCRPAIFDHRPQRTAARLLAWNRRSDEPERPRPFQGACRKHDRRGLHQQAADRTKFRQDLDPAQPPHLASRRHLRRRDRGVGRSRAALPLLSIDQYRAATAPST